MSIWGEEIIGIIKLRHRLNEMLRKTGHGHIGYCIAKSYRGRGYGKEMLRQGLEILRSRPDFADEYIMLSCDADNIASLLELVFIGEAAKVGGPRTYRGGVHFAFDKKIGLDEDAHRNLVSAKRASIEKEAIQ